MKAWIEKPVSELPKTNAEYIVFNKNNHRCASVSWQDRWQFASKLSKVFTHYLVPAEGNFLTDAEIEKIASDAWDAGMRYGVADERSSWGTKMPTNKTEYLKSIKHETQ